MPKKTKSKILWGLIIFALSFVYRLWGIEETGGLWDEDAYFSSGFHYYYNVSHGQFDPDQDWGWNYEHPPVGKYLYGLGTLVSYKLPDNENFSPRLNYLPGRLESVAVGSLTCVGVLLVGWLLFSPSVGVLSALVLSFLPLMAGYNRIIGLESPLALFWVFGTYFFLKAVLQGGNSRFYLLAGFMAAFSFATKYSGGLILLLFGLVYVWGKFTKIDRAPWRKVPRNMLLIPVIMVAFLYLSFPWLWQDPLPQFWKSFSFSKQHVGFSDYQPLYYLKYLLATTPLLILLLSLVTFSDLRFSENKRRCFVVGSLWLGVLVPLSLGLFGFKGAGVRNVIFVLPILSLLAGLGGVKLLALLSQHYKLGPASFRRLFLGMAVFVSGYLFWQASLVHPYEVDYYSEAVGGVSGAVRLGLGISFRGEGGSELINWANDNLPPEARVRVAIAPLGNSSLKEELRLVDSGDLADYYVCLHPCEAEIEDNPSLESIYTVKVGGVGNLGEVLYDPTAKGK